LEGGAEGRVGMTTEDGEGLKLATVVGIREHESPDAWKTLWTRKLPEVGVIECF
jgi:hypothetical protein